MLAMCAHATLRGHCAVALGPLELAHVCLAGQSAYIHTRVLLSHPRGGGGG